MPEDESSASIENNIELPGLVGEDDAAVSEQIPNELPGLESAEDTNAAEPTPNALPGLESDGDIAPTPSPTPDEDEAKEVEKPDKVEDLASGEDAGSPWGWIAGGVGAALVAAGGALAFLYRRNQSES